MNHSRESSAIAYLVSKESTICPPNFKREAEKLRASIKAGKVSGLTFPEPEPKHPNGQRYNYTDAQKRKMLKKANSLRKGGASRLCAIGEAGLTAGTYDTWSRKFGIKYTDLARKAARDTSNDVEITELVNGGMTMEAACSRFGVNAASYRQRSIKNGLRKPIKRLKMTEEHVKQIAEVNELRKTMNCADALKRVGITGEQYRRYSERLNFNTQT